MIDDEGEVLEKYKFNEYYGKTMNLTKQGLTPRKDSAVRTKVDRRRASVGLLFWSKHGSSKPGINGFI